MIRRICAAALVLISASYAAAAELIMFEEDGCVYCARWKNEIGPIYPKTPEAVYAPLTMQNIAQPVPDTIALAQAVVFTPTFVLVEDGQELGRIEGYPGEEMFWWMLARLLSENSDYEKEPK